MLKSMQSHVYIPLKTQYQEVTAHGHQEQSGKTPYQLAKEAE
jgi:hypothetical protein